MAYQLLFSYMGTYPNINLTFSSQVGTNLSIYEVIDLYNEVKNKIKRDFIYINVSSKTSNTTYKIKKYTNLKELLNYIGINEINKLVLNRKIKLNTYDFLLDENTLKIEVS